MPFSCRLLSAACPVPPRACRPHRSAVRLHATVEDEVELCEVLNASDEEFGSWAAGPRIPPSRSSRARQGVTKRCGTVLSHVELEKKTHAETERVATALGRWRLVFHDVRASWARAAWAVPAAPTHPAGHQRGKAAAKMRSGSWVDCGTPCGRLEHETTARPVDVIKRFGIGSNFWHPERAGRADDAASTTRCGCSRGGRAFLYS